MDLRMTARGQNDPGQQPGDDSSLHSRDLSSGDVKRGTSQSGDGQESRLIEAATGGDRHAKESLISEHLGWVQSAAAQRTGRGLSEGDLVQEGSLGLLRAIHEFAGSGRTDFESFAREQVTAQMEQAIAQEGRAQEESRRLVEAAEDFQKVEFALRRELGRDATPAELAAKLEWPQDRTDAIAEMVADARRRHDEELLNYLEPEDIDLDRLIDGASDTDPSVSNRPRQNGANGDSGAPRDKGQGPTSAER
jgi:RNA polymerase sigma factor (sigma-70 family)